MQTKHAKFVCFKQSLVYFAECFISVRRNVGFWFNLILSVDVESVTYRRPYVFGVIR